MHRAAQPAHEDQDSRDRIDFRLLGRGVIVAINSGNDGERQQKNAVDTGRESGEPAFQPHRGMSDDEGGRESEGVKRGQRPDQAEREVPPGRPAGNTPIGVVVIVRGRTTGWEHNTNNTDPPPSPRRTTPTETPSRKPSRKPPRNRWTTKQRLPWTNGCLLARDGASRSTHRGAGRDEFRGGLPPF